LRHNHTDHLVRSVRKASLGPDATAAAAEEMSRFTNPIDDLLHIYTSSLRRAGAALAGQCDARIDQGRVPRTVVVGRSGPSSSELM
jgi:hypothetical protein